MVNRGRPSRGCLLCRARRIKCDETRPDCTQCRRRNRPCPGYKDTPDNAHGSEGGSTESRAVTTQKGNEVVATHSKMGEYDSASTPDSDNSWAWGGSDVLSISSTTSHSGSASSMSIQNWVPSGKLSHRSSSSSMPHELNISLEEQAMCHFLANWVILRPGIKGAHGYMECLLALMGDTTPPSHFILSLRAVALASLASRPHSNALLPKASASYAQALNQLNAALRDPVMAYKDHTLASVILLGLYETLTSTKIQQESRESHINGAVALCKARGIPQTQIAQELHNTVRGQMIVSRMINTRAPELTLDWWVERDSVDNFEQSGAQINLLVTELRADAEKILPLPKTSTENISKVTQLMRRIETLEADYCNWEASLPPLWRAQTVAWFDPRPSSQQLEWFEELPQIFPASESHKPFPGRVDTYGDLWTVNFRNILRASRLLLASTFIRCAAWFCAPQDYRMTDQYARTKLLVQELITDILASVPNYIDLEFPKASTSTSTSRSNARNPSHSLDPHSTSGMGTDANGNFHLGTSTPPLFPVGDPRVGNRGVAGLFLLWPLISVASSDFATDAQREWVKGKLRFMGETMGINRASMLARVEIRLPSMVIKRDAAARTMLSGSQALPGVIQVQLRNVQG